MGKSSDMSLDENRICVGVVVGSHGLQGAVKIKSYMEVAEDIAAYGPVTDKSGERRFDIRLQSGNQKGLVAMLSGIKDRNASEAARGMELYLSKEVLPALDEEEFYYADLIGLPVELKNGDVIGTVVLVDNYGAGEVIEVGLKDGGTEMFPMSREIVPEVDLKNGRIVVNPPDEIYADENHDDEETEEKNGT